MPEKEGKRPGNSLAVYIINYLNIILNLQFRDP